MKVEGMYKEAALELLKSALSEVTLSDGSVAAERFAGLREVDAKTREVRMVLENVEGLPKSLLSNMNGDIDFTANSRRVRLECLANYIRSAVKFLNNGAFDKPQQLVLPPPDLQILTGSIPGLEEVVASRWCESQRCVHAQAYTAAVILMGSILEGLLLARASLTAALAYQSSRAPKDKAGKTPALHDWSLSNLIDVATDVGWLKVDRGKFSHALRESRNVVHPWQAVSSKADFDEATCKTSWHVLEASVNDLKRSVT